MASWLGLDFGTSSVKALVADEKGEVRSRSSVSYVTTFGAAGEAEQDALCYITAATRAIAECEDAIGVSAVGLVGQTPTLVVVDKDRRPLIGAMTWQDTRSVAEAKELQNRLGDSFQLVGTSLPWAPANAPSKLLWLRRHTPQIVNETRWVLQPKDFAGLWMTGQPTSDPWSSKGLCNVRTNEPAVELLHEVGWPASVVPRLAPAWSPRGSVTKEGADIFGLREGVPVSVGWSDALAGMLAVGAFSAPTAFLLSGTSDIVGMSSQTAPASAPNLLVVPETCAPLPVVYGPTQASGASIEWVARLLGIETSTVDALASRASEELPLFIPYIMGERAPVWRSDVRGAFLGLSARHGSAEIARSVLTGVTLAARHVLQEVISVLDCSLAEVHVGGHSAASGIWRDVRLTTLGHSLALHKEPQCSTLGAAMLAATAEGVSVSEIGNAMAGAVQRLEPSLEQVAIGNTVFQQYQQGSRQCLQWSA